MRCFVPFVKMKVLLLVTAMLGLTVAEITDCPSGSGEVWKKLVRASNGDKRTCNNRNPDGFVELNIMGCDCPEHRPYSNTITDTSGAQHNVCSDAQMCDGNFVPCSHTQCQVKPLTQIGSTESHHVISVSHHNLEASSGGHFCSAIGQGRTQECQCLCRAQ